MKAFVRRWLGLDGPGGLADVLAVKDSNAEVLKQRIDGHEALLRKIVPQLNDNTQTCQRLGVYEQQVPSIKRVFDAMRARAIRERKRREAEQALAAPPVVAPTHPPMDAVLDDVSAEVGGG